MNNTSTKTRTQNWKLSPSDFAFLWEECRRCFYLKGVEGFRRPSTPWPKIFTATEQLMKKCFSGKQTEEVLPAVPGGGNVRIQREVGGIRNSYLAWSLLNLLCMGKPR